MKPTLALLTLAALAASLSSAFAGGRERPLEIGVIADLNGDACQPLYPANSTLMMGTLLAQHDPDLIISTGDAVGGECITYKGAIPYDQMVRKMWQEFDDKFVKPAHAEGAGIILAPGNHDASSYTNRETFKTEAAEFGRYWQERKASLPAQPLRVRGASDKFPYYWAYVYEGVLFVVLRSTQTQTLADTAAQKAWLKAVLASPTARDARARIVYGHIPPYAVLDPSVGFKYGEILAKEQVGQPDSLTDLLLDSRVDLLLVGHSHAPYPGELTRARDGKKLRILSMPCAHGARKLLGKGEISPRGFAVVRLSETNQLSLSVLDYKTGAKIPASYYPASIPQKDGKVTYKRLAAPALD